VFPGLPVLLASLALPARWQCQDRRAPALQARERPQRLALLAQKAAQAQAWQLARAQLPAPPSPEQRGLAAPA
jgi:hypothetical protein